MAEIFPNSIYEKLTVMEKGHITGSLSYEKLRRHILEKMDE